MSTIKHLSIMSLGNLWDSSFYHTYPLFVLASKMLLSLYCNKDLPLDHHCGARTHSLSRKAYLQT